MKAKDYRQKAWEMLKKNENYWPVLVITFVAFILAAIPFVGIILAGPALVGLNLVLIKVYREDNLNVELALEPAKKSFVNTLIGHILEVLFTALWGLLFVIPGIVKSYSYSMTKYILADNPELSGKQALEASKKMMYGHKSRLFWLDMSFIGWILLGVITFGIGLVFLAPYQQAARTAFYLDLVNQNKEEIGKVELIIDKEEATEQ